MWAHFIAVARLVASAASLNLSTSLRRNKSLACATARRARRVV